MGHIVLIASTNSKTTDRKNCSPTQLNIGANTSDRALHTGLLYNFFCSVGEDQAKTISFQPPEPFRKYLNKRFSGSIVPLTSEIENTIPCLKLIHKSLVFDSYLFFKSNCKADP